MTIQLRNKKINYISEHYYTSLFVLVLLIFIFYLFVNILDFFGRGMILVNMMLNKVLISFNSTTDINLFDDDHFNEFFIGSLNDAVRYINSEKYMGTLKSIYLFSFILTLSLVFLIFINSRRKILKYVVPLEQKNPAILNLTNKIREILNFKKLRIFYNPSLGADTLSFSSIFHKYIILNNSALTMHNSEFSFLIHHELCHLKKHDSLFISFLEGSSLILYTLVPLLSISSFMVLLGYFFSGKQMPITFLLTLVLLLKISIVYYFYKSYKNEFLFLKEFFADNFAYSLTNIIPAFRSSKRHPDPDIRNSYLKTGTYSIDLIPLLFFVFIILNLFYVSYEMRILWSVIFLLSTIILIDKFLFKKFNLKTSSFLVFSGYLMCLVIESLLIRLYTFPENFMTFLKVYIPLNRLPTTDNLLKFSILYILIFIILLLSLILLRRKNAKNN